MTSALLQAFWLQQPRIMVRRILFMDVDQMFLYVVKKPPMILNPNPLSGSLPDIAAKSN
jgi:hypothetical protein